MGRETEIIIIAAVFAALLLRFVRLSMIFKCFFISYRICKNVLFWTFVRESLVVFFLNNFGENVSDSYFTCLNLNSGFLCFFFFFKSEMWYSLSCIQEPSVFFRGAFYSAVETIMLNSCWQVRNVVVWTEQSLVSSTSEGHERCSAELQ